MNLSGPIEEFHIVFIRNFTSVLLGIIINYINGTLVFTFFKNSIFYTDPRYILYIHLVINDIIMLTIAVGLQVVTYAMPYFRVSVCCVILLLASTTTKNTPLNLAGMAIERYIAICKPLHHPQICTVHRTYILIFLIWIVSVIPEIGDIFIAVATQPVAFFSTSTFCYNLGIYFTPQHKDKSTVVQAVLLSFVWVTLIFTYFNVLFAAKAATNSARKARSTILLHGVQLLLCMLSYISPVINFIFIPLFPNRRREILFVTFLLVNVFPRLLSPLIYGVRDQKFVKHIKIYLLCKLHVVQVKPDSK
ncbi:odorant receptor 131-2-like [Chanos chanos]|uniref:Odorant receptor 131-2-like n=1 Tax=Chanos chanos TaxID=29144 RepID=A0A6J2VUS2_CHACN|nr:odorant receptor 131-2-like [Chanos chanos]